MRLHTDKLAIRLPGTLLGLAFIAIGLFSLFGGGDDLSSVVRERAVGFGITAVIAGIAAIGSSLLPKDLSNIWCSPPARWWNKKKRPG
jgi:hypothetical protein